MATDEILRLHYYERQYLGAADLEDQQTYLRDMRRRHNIGHHTWGIVTGLELTQTLVAGDPTAVDVFVQPGMAIDGFGREIIVMAPVKLDTALFEAFANQQHRMVFIHYDQVQTQQPQAGFVQCDVSNQFGRIQETYNFSIDPTTPNQDVSVNGKPVEPTNDPEIPQDQSVPYQEFPDDTTVWLLQLGSVNWDGVNRKFLPASPHSRLTVGRSYMGAVAQTIYSPVPEPVPDPKKPDPATDAPLFFIQPRFKAADPDVAGFAEIVGRLQVDGRITAKKAVLIHGDQLQFLDQGGQTDNVPLWMQRTAGPSGTGTDLHIHIGDSVKDAATRLSIGPKSATEESVLAVRADNNVDIATGWLNFGSTTRQMLNLLNLNYGIGVQAGTLYFRSESDFRWYKGGKHSDDLSSADNGALQLRLDASANLHFGTQTRQMLNLWDVQYGIGVQASTLYFRTHGDFCWFRNGGHSDARDDPGGGVRAMRLDSNSKLTVTGNLATQSNLSVSGNATIGGKTTINDDVNVSGKQNLVDAFTQAFAIQNNGNTFQTWNCNHANRFSKVYARFAVFQGFSLFAQGGNTQFNNFGRVPNINAIPQHAFVRVDGGDNNHTNGTCFCSESSAGIEGDNTILFTVVVIGKPLNAQ
jgi:hypothetical protein